MSPVCREPYILGPNSHVVHWSEDPIDNGINLIKLLKHSDPTHPRTIGSLEYRADTHMNYSQLTIVNNT